MEFKDKLPLIRKERGLSQEGLAEIIGVTRQAVAKWELGQGYPDIDNLIRLSNVFKISIDRLIKPEDLNYFIAFNKKETDDNDEEIINFLVKAKKETYAGKGPECEPSRPNSHDLRYEEGDYLYIDTYIGGEKFGGEEAVWYQGMPVWSMNYIGRLLGNNFSGDFLKEALKIGNQAFPCRGPMLYQNGDYIYHCDLSGSFEWYQGYEEIFCQSVKIYECYFHGGKIK